MSSTTRELRAEIDINAPVERVWAVVTDIDAMVQGSPELLGMTPLLRGGLRTGQQYIGWNKRGLVVWPTRNVVVEVEVFKRLAWDTKTSGARWIYELEPSDSGTRLIARRPIPGTLNPVGKAFAALLLGGGESHADELEEALATTIAKFKAIAEA